MPDEPLPCTVIGAGALGLGFLGPELAEECRLTYLDIPAKGKFLRRLAEAGHYTLNQTGLSVRSFTVGPADGRALTDEPSAGVCDALDAAELVFTAVGAANLPKLAPLLAAAAGRRTAERPLRVLCGENGVDIALSFRRAVCREADTDPGAALLVGDTVMGRMCKIARAPDPPIEPVAPGLDWAVVSEAYFGIPVTRQTLRGLSRIPSALLPQGQAEFEASEDTKMLAHNGLHALLACLGRLRGAEYFSDLRDDAELMAMARRMLFEEVAPALLRKHAGVLGRNDVLNYCDWILRRTTCPVFSDVIARGVRGIMRKLQPRERLVYSLRTVAEQGVEPRVYAMAVAAAVTIARAEGETDLPFRRVLTQHCGLDPQADAELLALIEGRREALG
ncbi:MAG: hypothetical protein R6V05_15010 [Candidatus Brocadiia bacterium]